MDTPGLTRVKSEIADAATRAGVAADSVTLVAVSKGQTNDAVMAVAHCGQVVFAENRQQGLAERIRAELDHSVEWHFIGPLQSRKASFVERHVSLLHSMDRMSLAPKWVAAGNTPVLLQFNLGREPQKSGFDPDDAVQVLDEALEGGLDVRGVMAIPPLASAAELTRPFFAGLRTIFDELAGIHSRIEHCSMGMSNDFGVAIEEGSTMVRVGRAIFEPTDS